ncbi:hypothetical protein NX059_004365 [Plenodomus lindquistii]|nr:hypothetical protein NX059_004365 [Plenodomus lindquistii]
MSQATVNMTADAGLRVTIVGGGIAGLFAARVLREKHTVTILERTASGNEVGAALTPGPNATKWLYKYGWKNEDARAFGLEKVRTLDHKGELVRTEDVSKIKEIFGSDWLVTHRIDLWRSLLKLATDPSEVLGISGDPARMIWRADVQTIDVDSGTVTLSDGTIIESDLVIGADGVKSIVRPHIVPDIAPKNSGASMFRFILPREVVEDINANPNSSFKFNIEKDLTMSLASDGSGRSVVFYPCRNGELLNVGCIAPDPTIALPLSDSWSAPGDREDMLRVFGDFWTRPLLEKAEGIKLWPLRDHDALPTYFKGRTVLIGDAAHAMTPHQGQGASQAIEDGEGMSIFIDQMVNRETVPELLRDFDRVRRVRATKVHANTREVHEKRNPEQMWKNVSYNMTYNGFRDAMAKLDRGEQI